MSININIADRLFAAFGFLPSGFPKRSVIEAGLALSHVEDAALNAGLGRANIALIKKGIGNNVYVADRSFADLTLKSTESGAIYKFATSILNQEADNILAPPPMFAFNRSKNIVTTQIDGSDAVVVESFGLTPWNITIEGILIDIENHHYPQQQLREFRSMFEENTQYDVLDCELLADLGIDSLYIERVNSLKVVLEFQDTIQYRLTAKSIKPAEFFI